MLMRNRPSFSLLLTMVSFYILFSMLCFKIKSPDSTDMDGSAGENTTTLVSQGSQSEYQHRVDLLLLQMHRMIGSATRQFAQDNM